MASARLIPLTSKLWGASNRKKECFLIYQICSLFGNLSLLAWVDWLNSEEMLLLEYSLIVSLELWVFKALCLYFTLSNPSISSCETGIEWLRNLKLGQFKAYPKFSKSRLEPTLSATYSAVVPSTPWCFYYSLGHIRLRSPLRWHHRIVLLLKDLGVFCSV